MQQIEELTHSFRALETEWNDVYDKMSRVASRLDADRRRRGGEPIGARPPPQDMSAEEVIYKRLMGEPIDGSAGHPR